MESFIKESSKYRELILAIENENKWTKPDDWYNISQKIIETHDRKTLRKYGRSAIKFVTENIDYNYKVFLFKTKPQKYWSNIENVKEYMLWLYDIMGFNDIKDWYKIRDNDFKKYNGNGLLDAYKNTIITILQDCYSKVVWYPWLFVTTTKGTWKDPKNHLSYLIWFEQQNNIQQKEDWYKYDCRDIENQNGGGLLQNYYDHSLKRLLKLKYPDLKSYMFSVTENGFWNDKENIKAYLKDLFEHLGYTSNEDWYNTSADDFSEFYGGGLRDKINPYWKIITENIDYEWELGKFKKVKYSKQACKIMETLQKMVSEKLEEEIYIRHAQNHTDGEFDPPDTNYSVDGYIEAYKIIIDFHGCVFHGCPKCYPHENEISPFGGRKHDTHAEKYNRTAQRKQTLIQVGYNVLEIWGCDINLVYIVAQIIDIVKVKD